MRLRRAFTLLLFAALFPLPPAQAQTLPDCPWPTSVDTDATYTLTQNCKVTDTVEISSSTVTINGCDTSANANCVGYSVDASALTTTKAVIVMISDASLNLNNITINGGGSFNSAMIHAQNAVTIRNTTFRNTYGRPFYATSGSGGTFSLSNVLIENALGDYAGNYHSGAAIQAGNNAAITVNDLVVRNSRVGNAAIGVFPTTTASITMTGCFTADGVWPQVFYGPVDRTAVTGECTGTIGNGGSATRQYNNASPSDCGLPLAGYVISNATYNLRADCQMTGVLFIPSGVTVTVNGGGWAILGDGNRVIFGAAGTLTIRNVIFSGGLPFYGLLNSLLTVERSTIRNSGSPVLIFDPTARFSNVLFENNVYSGGNTNGRASAMRILYGSNVTIRDSIFRGNTGGRSVLWVGFPRADLDSVPSLTLEGCISFESNSSTYVDFTDIVDGATPPDSYVTDNRTGPCVDTFTIGASPPFSFQQISPDILPDHRSGSDSSAHSSSKIRVHTCPDLAPEIIVTDLTGSTQCQRIESAGIGIPFVLAAQPVDAVDVWSWVGTGTRVCFQDSGAGIVFLDANDAPRSVRVLPAYHLNDMTCVNIDDHGSVVLLNTQPAGLPPLMTVDELSRNLSGCMVTLREILNFRREPGGEVMKLLPSGVKLTAFQQRSNWIEVDYHGQRGWVSADYVGTEGNCA